MENHGRRQPARLARCRHAAVRRAAVRANGCVAQSHAAALCEQAFGVVSAVLRAVRLRAVRTHRWTQRGSRAASSATRLQRRQREFSSACIARASAHRMRLQRRTGRARPSIPRRLHLLPRGCAQRPRQRARGCRRCAESRVQYAYSCAQRRCTPAQVSSSPLLHSGVSSLNHIYPSQASQPPQQSARAAGGGCGR